MLLYDMCIHLPATYNHNTRDGQPCPTYDHRGELLQIDYIAITEGIHVVHGSFHTQYIDSGKLAMDHLGPIGQITLPHRHGNIANSRTRPAYNRSLVSDPACLSRFDNFLD